MLSKTGIFPGFLALSLLLISGVSSPVPAKNGTSGAAPPASSITATGADPKMGIEAFKLKNGLKVLLVERAAAPVVVVNMIYHVGSRNEAVGYTGSTHFLEHLMFKGTAAHDPLKGTGLDDLLKGVGGINNATTSYDRTNYYEVVPRESVDLALQLEADRMRHLLLRKADRDAEMTVVRNELERGEDEPSELLSNMAFATAFKEHPYHHPVIGWRSDVEGVPLSRLRRFYDDFYWPDNATLVVTGDFRKKELLKKIEAAFGGIPSSPKPFPAVYTKEPAQEGERRFLVSRGKELPRVLVAFHTPRGIDRATAPLDVVASVLGDSSRKSSRLYKSLIETGLCSECSASNYTLLDPGLFFVQATVQPGQNPRQVEAVILAELNRINESGITETELLRARQSIVKRFKLSLSDPMNLTQSLTEGIAVGSWQWWCAYPDSVAKVSLAEAKDFAGRTFTENNRTVGYYLPKPTSESYTASTGYYQFPAPKPVELPALAGGELEQTQGSFPFAGLLTAGSGKSEISPRVKKVVLENGLTVLLYPIARSGTVAISGKIRAGDYFARAPHTERNDLLARLLSFGTKTYSKQELAQKLESMGASLDFDAETFFHNFETEVTTQDLPLMVKLLASCMIEPSLRNEDLKEVSQIYAAQLKEESTQTATLAWNKVLGTLYKKDSVYHADDFDEQIKAVSDTTIEEIRAHHKAQYRPANTVLTLVGDFDVDKACALLQETFSSGQWPGDGKGPSPIKVEADVLEKVSDKTPLVSKLAEKANVDIVLARPVNLSVRSSDYLAALVANAVLGYDSFACRLAPVRDRYGLTYGIYSRIVDPEFPYGPWSIELSVNPENVKRALEIVKKIVGEFDKGGISPGELAKEKSHLAGAYLVGLRSPRALARKICEYEQLGLPLKNLDNFPWRLSKITLKDVNEAIRKHFDVTTMQVSLSGTLD